MDPTPRWPHYRNMSPSALKTYRICPYRARLQYVDRVKAPDKFIVFFAKGNAAHQALQEIADSHRFDRPRVSEERVIEIARQFLPEREYATVSPEARQADIDHVCQWVRYGRTYLEWLVEPEWLLVESFLERPWPVVDGLPPVTLISKPDLIVRRPDEDGEPMIEIIDYKTGTVRPEPEPPVIQRFVARELLQHVTGNASLARVRFTYLWLAHQQHDVVDLSVEYCTAAWDDIVQQMRDLLTETEWRPDPGFMCNYCPYGEGICPYSMADAVRDTDDDRYDG